MWEEIVYLQLIVSAVFHKQVVSCIKISEFPWPIEKWALLNSWCAFGFFLWKSPLVWPLKIINIATWHQYVFDFHYASQPSDEHQIVFLILSYSSYVSVVYSSGTAWWSISKVISQCCFCIEDPNYLFPSRVKPWEMESLEPNIARKCCFCSKVVIGLEFSGLHLPWTWCGTGCTPWIQIVLTLIVLQVPRLPWVVTQTTLQAWQWHWWNAVWVQCYMYSLEPIPLGEKRVLSLM